MDGLDTSIKKKRIVRYCVTLIHFLLSFFYERLIFDFSEDRSVVLSIAKNNIVSDHFEFVESYLFSKLFAFLFIFLLWKIVFYVSSHISKSMIIHLVIFAVGTVVLLLSWPAVFAASEDNFVTLSYALRFYPEYWHSAYSSFVYAGLMMVFPHPASITFLQWFFFMSLVGYISERIKAIPVFRGQGLYIAYIMVVVPEWFLLISNAYRTEQYAILCVFYISILALDMIEKKKRSTSDIILLAVLSAFISVWRSEGIILGFLAFLASLIFSYKESFKKVCLYMLGFILLFILIALPQKLGDQKYYGKDYSYINSFPTLANILNSNNGVLKEYEGIEKDLEAINKVVPIDLVKAYGMEGYRRYNFSNGRNDINQSLSDKETASEYMSAYYRLVLHNPVIYAKTQLSMLLYISGIKNYTYIEHCSILGEWEDIDNYTYYGWGIGKDDLNSMPLVSDISKSHFLNEFSSIVLDTVITIRTILKSIYIRTITIVAIPLAEIYVVIYELIMLIKRKPHCTGLGALALILLGQAFAISLVMPAAVIAYFHAYLNCSSILLILYFVVLRNERMLKRLPKD